MNTVFDLTTNLIKFVRGEVEWDKSLNRTRTHIPAALQIIDKKYVVHSLERISECAIKSQFLDGNFIIFCINLPWTIKNIKDIAQRLSDQYII